IENSLQLGTGLAINEFSSDGNLTDNSDSAIPTEQAVKTYVDNQITQVNNALDTRAALNGAANQNFATNNLTVGGNLQVSGDLEVQGNVIARDTEHIAGNVSLGDQDSDEVKIIGVIRSGHSSGSLRIDDALHTTGSVSVDGSLSVRDAIATAQLSVTDRVSGSLTIENNLTVGNAISTAQLSVTDRVTSSLTVGDNLTVSNTIIANKVSSSGLEISILDKPALQLFAPEQKNTYLSLINPNGQQAIQLDTTTGAGSIRLKNSEAQGVGAFQTSEDAGLLRIYNKTGERTTIELFANQGESGVLKLFGVDGSEKIQLSEDGINTSGTVIANNISSRGSFTSNSISASNIYANQFSAVKTRGWITKTFADNNPAVQVALLSGNSAGWLGLFDSNNRRNVTIQGDGNIFCKQLFSDTFGTINTNRTINKKFSNGRTAVRINTAQGGKVGWLGIYDSNGNRNVTLVGDGEIFTKRVTVGSNTTNNGFIETKSQDNQPLVRISTLSGRTNHGWVGIYDSNGNRNVTLVGDGGIFGKTKNFIIDHPLDETKNIIYAAIEGPEAAAYIRGKSKLSDGQAEIVFPEHFSLVVNSDSITIQLTPRSAESKGLAVVSHSERGFSVKELCQGEGNYEFDYFVAGVRQGMENFTPVVDKGLTAFGEPMGVVADDSTVTPQPASMIEEMVPSEAVQPAESPSSPEPQASNANEPLSTPIIEPQTSSSEGGTSGVSVPSISSIPSPPAINFADKQL
ncbi:MAG: hypothetical protein F6K26_27095, partial [Moorea sp. SIO2I5]|nr:hypothetical protein [Moorena sp. SIO2I5]